MTKCLERRSQEEDGHLIKLYPANKAAPISRNYLMW